MRINENYKQLAESYLFSRINQKVSKFREENPEANVIRMGIGDVTRPLCPAVVDAMTEAVAEMGKAETFRGYGPEQGYDFLRERIAEYYKTEANVTLSMEEIFISDGAKSDLGNILDLFGKENRVLIPSPVYPVYVDTNVMAGREITYLEANQENGFLPMPPAFDTDIIYLCSPNNPTGAAYHRSQLKEWVDYANRCGAVLLYDAAYEAFITDQECPRSIFEIDGARTCAIEFCSLSKTAGFTGTRCGYTVVPLDLVREGAVLNHFWLRRQTTKFNGVPYIVQRGAAAVFTPEGMRQCRENLKVYQENAKIISDCLKRLDIWHIGGKNSPYIWLKCPNGMDSWTFFEDLLERANVVGTPGEGFGKSGDGFFRLTSFGTPEATKEAMARIERVYAK